MRVYNLVAAAFGVVLSACGSDNLSVAEETRFQCGAYIPGTSTIRQCGRPREVCVCSTNSCAFVVGTDEVEGGCPEAGLLYSEPPFARSDLAGKCVKKGSAASVLRPESGQVSCPLPGLGLPPTSTTAGPSGNGD